MTNSFMMRLQEYQDDPDIFDGRKELAMARLLVEQLVQRVEASNFADDDVLTELRQYLGMIIAGQDKVIHTLAAKNFYLTVAQVETIMRQFGGIWHEEAMNAIEQRPELRQLFIDVESEVARRVGELAFPEPEQSAIKEKN